MNALLGPPPAGERATARRPKVTPPPAPQTQHRQRPGVVPPSTRRAPASTAPSPPCPRPSKPEVPSPPPPSAVAETPAPTSVTEPCPPAALPLEDPAVLAALNRQAAVLANALFPTQMLHALRLDDSVSVTAVRLFLATFRRDAGEDQDAVEKLLLDQLALAHFKVGQLHAAAENAGSIDFKGMYLAAATRLLREISRTVETLVNYRASLRRREPNAAASNAGVSSSLKKKPGKRKGK